MSEEKEIYQVDEPKRVILSREAVLTADDLLTEWVEVPEWGGSIQIRALTVREVEHIMRLSTNKKGAVNTTQSSMLMFVRAVVEPKFTDMDIDDLKGKSALVFRIVKDINRLSGITDDAVELAEKN